MGPMDERSTPETPDDDRESIESLQARLKDADPADAPGIADELAARLAERLDEGTGS